MHSILKTSLAALVAAGVTATAASADGHALSGELNITSDMSNPAPRAVMEKLAADFDAMHDDLTVNLTIVDREAWKTQIRNALGANPPDVVNWYAATRMTPYVDAGLFMDISDLWAEPEMAGLASTKGAMTLDGKQWGVPYTYYQWGVYYRKDIYEELGLSEPATWEEELANCQAILDSGRKCYTIGSKFLWTAGGWFDYINSRTNGYDFHIQLANGEVAWTDDRVRETFANWRQLIDMGAYIDDHQSYSWQEAMPFMVDGEAAAYLMGNFSVAAFRDSFRKASKCCPTTHPAASCSSSTVTSLPRWRAWAWKACKSSWCSQITWTTSLSVWKKHVSASTSKPNFRALPLRGEGRTLSTYSQAASRLSHELTLWEQ